MVGPLDLGAILYQSDRRFGLTAHDTSAVW